MIWVSFMKLNGNGLKGLIFLDSLVFRKNCVPQLLMKWLGCLDCKVRSLLSPIIWWIKHSLFFTIKVTFISWYRYRLKLDFLLLRLFRVLDFRVGKRILLRKNTVVFLSQVTLLLLAVLDFVPYLLNLLVYFIC